MNVTLSGKEITVKNNGIVSAKNLIIAASDDDHQLDFTVGGSTVGIEDSGFDTEVSASLFDVVSTAKVGIGANAVITVLGDVVITAKCVQDQPMLLSANFNVVSVKIGSATIDIDGIIKAGGSVSASASANVTVVASNEILAKLFIPLAVNVVVTESAVRVSGRIDAGSSEVAGGAGTGDVKLSADGNLSVTTTASTGKLPFSLAISVVVNDVNVELSDGAAVTATGGDVSLNANGSSTVTTKASKGDSDTANSGGYFALGIVIQNVSATIGDSAHVSGGNISVVSKAVENVVTNATSAKPETSGDSSESGGGSGTLSSVLTMAKGLLGTVKDTIVSKFSASQPGIASKFGLTVGSATSQMEGSGTYQITSSQVDGGSVSTQAKADSGNTVTLTITPKSGYELDGIQVSYLLNGAWFKTVKNLGDTIDGGSTAFFTLVNGKYTFVMPEANVTVAVTFKAVTPTSATGTDTDTGNLFDEEDEDDSMGLEDLFNEGTSGTEDAATPSNRATENSTATDANLLTVERAGTNGAVLIDHYGRLRHGHQGALRKRSGPDRKPGNRLRPEIRLPEDHLHQRHPDHFRSGAGRQQRRLHLYHARCRRRDQRRVRLR